MTERQDKILKALIMEYVRTAEPVGSELLTERYHLPYSSATVRSELAQLEEEGYLDQPHTSAGRIPTDLGYRYFVNQTMPKGDMPREEAEHLKTELLHLQTKHNRLARSTAKLLAGLSQNLAIAGLIGRDEFHEAGLSELLKEPEFLESECLLDVSKLLGVLEDNFESFVNDLNSTPHVYIGEENPYAPVRHLSMVLASCTLPSGERGLLAIIGPTRMRYDKNIRLLKAVAEAMEQEDINDNEDN